MGDGRFARGEKTDSMFRSMGALERGRSHPRLWSAGGGPRALLPSRIRGKGVGELHPLPPGRRPPGHDARVGGAYNSGSGSAPRRPAQAPEHGTGETWDAVETAEGIVFIL